MSKRVLIVDDSLVSRMMIKEIVMSRYPDWECVQAASAEKAVDACNQSQFDFVTLDLNMPGKSGLEAAPEILASQDSAKVALLTANIQSATRDKAEALGIAFITKPISEDGVLGFIEG